MNAIITGATKGIGKAVAEELAAKGWNLAVCSRNLEELQELKAALTDQHPSISVHCFQADLRQKSESKAFGRFSLDHLGEVHVLVNNAGLFIPGAVHTEEEGSLEQMIETNLYSAYYLTREIISSMKHNKKGWIVNISSIAGIDAYPNGGSYGISKFALRGFSMALREELKEYGIKVTTVIPGATWSNSWAGVELPESRLMQASDIAKSIGMLFELSDAAVVEEIILRPQLGDL